MSALPALTEEIKALVLTGDLTRTPRMEQLARALVDESRPILDRLRRCEEYLQKGLRSEALHLAKAEPDLLDAINHLDFADRASWDSAVSLYGLPLAARPSHDSAGALNQAFADEEPLKPLLTKHRLLALSRSPYLERMNVLRQLLALDPSNVAFQEDLARFETWRLETIRSEITEAKKNYETGKILDLLKEVEESVWVNPPPAVLVHEIKTIGDKARKETLTIKANALLPQILFARKNKDEPRVRQLLGDVERIAAEMGWTSSDEVLFHLQPTYAWLRSLEEQQQVDLAREAACGELERHLLQQGITEESIIERMNHIRQIGPLPAMLERQCDQTIERMRAARIRKEYLILGFSLAAGALALVAFVVILITRNRG